MGVRGEIFSTKVGLPNRTYFFNVKENRMGDLYLNIVESKNRESGGFERQSVIFFAEDLPEVLSGFDEALRFLEKAGREKKRNERFSPGGNRGGFRDAGQWDRERSTGSTGDREREGERPERRYRERPERGGYRREQDWD